ncbi:MAG: SNF2-related protein [Deltaproteobacteria bacterium]|jgi:superfamily II DNA or RNA helicase|nr:SNF2-related protein [Deltaproteobacteria bacterium]
MITDTTFFTNEPGYALLDRFKKTLKHVQYFDVLVGYFRTSGFHQLCESFESIDKIRILVGLNIDRKAYDIIESVRSMGEFDFESHSRTKKIFSEQTASEMDESEDSYEAEIGIRKFIEFLTADCLNREQDIANGGNGKKMELRAYPSENIHAKVYISRFKEGELDFGRVITGSSNFSESGLVANREFNVELKNKVDVDFALNQFETLWKDGVNISQEYVETIQNKTWLNDTITPYHLYLKMIYEYLKEDINLDEEIDLYLPEGFMELKYQKQAVVSARKILDAYNGVFLADVVGLGKTYISALLAQQLPGSKLIICPPVLKDYWEETFFEFGIQKFRVESLGKLDQVIKDGADKYDYIFIDEAHRFRNEYTQSFESIHQICFGKKVVLVSATPLNNTFDDILSQLKLFQIPKKSTIPGVPNLEKFFKRLEHKLKGINKCDSAYMGIIQEGSKEIRENILKYIMVRRTRAEVTKYFGNDIDEQGLFFPEVEDPRRFIYQFDEDISTVFSQTIDLLKKIKYARYTPLLYLKKELPEFEKQSQRNVGGFMKVIIVKRLESSFYAFRKTLDRFVESYVNFIDMFNKGTILISKKVDVYDLLDEDNEEKILQLIEQEKLERYNADEFKPELIEYLNADLKSLKAIRGLWAVVDSDPKLKTFIHNLKTDKELKGKKIIIFTESKETGDYLFENLNRHFPDKVLFYSSNGGLLSDGKKPVPVARDLIKENYDPTCKVQNDELRILISTDILAEGINLHRSNIIINYDLPWNPTKVLQRVGRVNRVGTEHKNIYIFNFFPTDQSDRHIGLEDNIKAKIQAFHDTLGEDARYLTEEEIVSSHELFGDSLYKRLTSKKTYQGDEEEEGRSELEYLKFIRDIRDDQPELFQKIKLLPKKARSAKDNDAETDRLLTFFRKGKLKKFFISGGKSSRELTFFEAVDIFKCEPDTPRQKISKQYYTMLDRNKARFDLITSGDVMGGRGSGGRGGLSNERYVIMRLKANEFRKYQGFTDDDEEYIRLVLKGYEYGVIPKNTTKGIKKKIEKEINPLKVLAILKKSIPYNILSVERPGRPVVLSKREVILSEYLAGEQKDK